MYTHFFRTSFWTPNHCQAHTSRSFPVITTDTVHVKCVHDISLKSNYSCRHSGLWQSRAIAWANFVPTRCRVAYVKYKIHVRIFNCPINSNWTDSILGYPCDRGSRETCWFWHCEVRERERETNSWMQCTLLEVNPVLGPVLINSTDSQQLQVCSCTVQLGFFSFPQLIAVIIV